MQTSLDRSLPRGDPKTDNGTSEEPLYANQMEPIPGGAPLLVSLRGKGALNQRLYRGLRHGILEGRFPAGTRLPSTRGLAADLGSPAT